MSNPIPMSNPIALRNLMITMVILGIAVIIVVRTPDAAQGAQLASGWLVSMVTLWLKSGRTPEFTVLETEGPRAGADKLPQVPPAAVLLLALGLALAGCDRCPCACPMDAGVDAAVGTPPRMPAPPWGIPDMGGEDGR